MREDNLYSILSRRADAVALIYGSDKYPNIHGNVMFYRVREGVLVRAEIMGLPKGPMCADPVFAFHIHSGTECSGNSMDKFANAGTHYNPGGCLHPYHAGDMPPLFGVNGNAFSVFLTDRFRLRDVLGKAVVIHAKPDDFKTQPAGDAGEKIACGIIK